MNRKAISTVFSKTQNFQGHNSHLHCMHSNISETVLDRVVVTVKSRRHLFIARGCSYVVVNLAQPASKMYVTY